MRGLYGWIGSAARSGESTPADVLHRVLPDVDKSNLQWIGGLDCSLVLHGTNIAGNLAQSNGLLSGCYGVPTWHEADLARLAEGEGNAAALAAGYARYKEKVADFLDGTFCFALIDVNRRQCILAVDRFAGYELCWSSDRGMISFGSSEEPVVRLSGGKRTVEKQAIFDYVYFNCVPSPASGYKSVQRLLPAHIAHLNQDGATTHRYWRPKFVTDSKSIRLEELEREFLNGLETAVAQCARGRRVGAFLSGGTDSSTVVGMLVKVRDAAETFSIGFDEPGYDELDFARIAARHFGCGHTEYMVTPQDVVAAVEKIAQFYGSPFGNASAIPTYYCARLAADRGLHWMVGGDGGDELFGGNERYAYQKLLELYHYLPATLRKRVLEPAADRIGGRTRFTLLKRLAGYVQKARVPMPDRLQLFNHLVELDVHQVFETEFIDQIDVMGPLCGMRNIYGSVEAKGLINKMLGFDFKYTLADNDLRKVTGMCQLAGVEPLYPLLHAPVVEASLRLPDNLKLKGFKLRYFFKHALRDFLPRETLTKTKHGFGLPFGEWVARPGVLRELSMDSLEKLKCRNIIRAAFIDDLVGRHLPEHPKYFGVLVWVLMMLELFFEKHVDDRKVTVS